MDRGDDVTLARGDTVRRLLERSLVLREVDATRLYFSRDFVLHMPLLVALPRGPWAWTRAVRFFLDGLSDIRVTVADVFGEGEELALRLLVEASHTGALGAIAATQAPICATGLSLWRFRGPVIAEAWIEFGLWDVVARQLDAVELVNSVVAIES